jgi:hypothetical protein
LELLLEIVFARRQGENVVMEGKSRVERFNEVVETEVRTRNFRTPIWTQAMVAAQGDVKTAEETYKVLRIQQMEEDEAVQERQREMRVVRDQRDVPPSRLITKVLFICLIAVLFAALVISIFWFQGRVRN